MATEKAQIVVDGDIAPLRRALREASAEIQRFGNTGNTAIDTLAGSVSDLDQKFGALGAVMAVGGFVTMAKQAIDSADALNDLADRTNTSVYALASYEKIVKLSDTTLEAFGKGLNKLSLYMVQNAEEAKRLGITARDPVQAFLQFVSALERAATPQDRSAIANRVLGKSFEELLPLLAQGAEKLRQAAAESRGYAESMDQLAPAAGRLNDRLDVLGHKLDAIKVKMAQAFVDLLPNAWTMDAASARIIELRGEIGRLQRALQNSPGSGLLHRMMYGTKDEITAKLAKLRAELAALSAQKSAVEKNSAENNQSNKKKLTFSDVEQAGKTPKKTAKPGEKISDVEWGLEESAHLTRTMYELGEQRAEAEEASFERAVKAAEEWEADLERANKAVSAATHERLQLDLMRAEGVRNAELARIDELEAAAAHEVEMGRATQADYLAALIGFNAQRLAIEQAYIEQKAILAQQDPEQNLIEFERIEQEKAEIRRRYGAQAAELQRQDALESQSTWKDLTGRLDGLWNQGMQALMNGTLTWRNGMRAIGAEVVSWFANTVLGGMVKKWIEEHARMLLIKMGFLSQEKNIVSAGVEAVIGKKATEATAVASANAVEAGTGAAASQASIPYIGPLLAIAAMASIFAAVSSMGNKVKSARNGYSIPRGVNPMVQLHEEEQVLPRGEANIVRSLRDLPGLLADTQAALAGGGVGGEAPIVLNLHATDAQSVRRLLMQNKATLVDAMKSAVRDFRS